MWGGQQRPKTPSSQPRQLGQLNRPLAVPAVTRQSMGQETKKATMLSWQREDFQASHFTRHTLLSQARQRELSTWLLQR